MNGKNSPILSRSLALRLHMYSDRRSSFLFTLLTKNMCLNSSLRSGVKHSKRHIPGNPRSPGGGKAAICLSGVLHSPPALHKSLSPVRLAVHLHSPNGNNIPTANVNARSNAEAHQGKGARVPLDAEEMQTCSQAVRVKRVDKCRAQPWESGFRELIQTQLNSYRLSRIKETNLVGIHASIAEEDSAEQDRSCDFHLINKGTMVEHGCRLPAIHEICKRPNKSFLYEDNPREVSVPAAPPGDRRLKAGVVGSKVSDRWHRARLCDKFAVRSPEPDLVPKQPQNRDTTNRRSTTIRKNRRAANTKSIPSSSANSSTLQIKSEARSATLEEPVAPDVPLPPVLSASLKGNSSHLPCSIVPVNLESEERAFFNSECKRNPQFQYENLRLVQRIVALYQKPSQTLLPLAIQIIEAFLARYTTETRHLERDGGDILTLEETRLAFQQYIDDLGLTQLIQLRFASNTVSPTTITHDPRTGISTVTVGLPIEYRRRKIRGVLNHEIGTHFIRKYNDRLQPWSHRRRAFQLKNYIATEEGLASINQLFELVNSPP